MLKDYLQILENEKLAKTSQLKNKDELPILALTYNSQEVVANTLFICKGLAFKKEYLEEAAKCGASAYVSEKVYDNVDLPYILVSDIRLAMTHLANLFYCNPWEDLHLVGIGGTKGKSTTAYYMKAVIDDYMAATSGKESAIISSIDTYDGISKQESHITTPEAIELNAHLRNALDSGITYGEMEVSSQALKYNRVSGLRFDIGIFLNVSEDHISPMEHKDYNDYFSSKMKMFAQTDTAIVNLDSDDITQVLEAAKAAKKVITFSTTNKTADYYASNLHKDQGEIVFTVRSTTFTEEFRLTMPGYFNVENALSVIVGASALHIPMEYIKSGLYRAKSSGRMELYSSKDGNIIAIVDYAHNKLSFQRLFGAVAEEYPDYDIVSIFGCPGRKALLRRHDLGTIAGTYAKKIYLVAEDPGTEPVIEISKDIAQYIEQVNGHYEIIEDRGEAIKKSILEAEGKTLILVTGKGNETRQKYGCQYLDCPSDVTLTKKYLAQYDASH